MSNSWRELAGVAPPLERPPRGAAQGRVELMPVVDDVRAFDALEHDWNALLERCDASVFQSFEWQRTWWRHFGEGGRGARLHLVTVRGPDGLVAAAPLYVERTRVLGVLGLRRLLFLGHLDSDYLDVLVARGWEAECADLIAEHLSSRADLFDVAVLEETPERSRTGRLLHDALLRRGWTATRSVQELCPQTALHATWDDTVAALDLRERRAVRRRLRNVAKDFRVELEVITAGAQVEGGMAEFIEMHQERWTRDGYSGVFADVRAAAFHRDVSERLSRRGWLYLAFLRVDGRRCAAIYGFSFGAILGAYLTGARHGADLARYSPGRVLHTKSMQWAIASGRTLYDFMRGTERYKYELGAVDVPNWRIVAYPRRARWTASKHLLHRMSGTVWRRVAREVYALRATSRAGGWLSRSVLRHVQRAAHRMLCDLRRVLRRRDRVDVEHP